MTTPEERQRELAQLYRLLQSGNFNGATIQRFQELVKEEVRPQVEASMAQRQRREAARRAAVAAGQRAGMEAGRRYVQRLQRGGRR